MNKKTLLSSQQLKCFRNTFAALCVLGFASTLVACATIPNFTAVYRGGDLFVCVGALKEDRCYKVEPEQASPNGDKAPE